MILSVDTETTGTDFFHGCRPFMVGCCDGDSTTVFEGSVNPYTREVFWDDDELDNLQEMLDKAEVLVFHNTQFDMRALESIGIKIDHLWDKIEDTLLCSHLFASGDSHGLKDTSIRYLQYWNDDEDELGDAVKHIRLKVSKAGYAIAKEGHPHFPATKGAVSWWKQDMWLAPEECYRYLCCDCERTWLLWHIFRPAITKYQHWNVYKLRKRMLRICYDITTEGMRLDIKRVNEYLERTERKMALIEKYLRKETKLLTKFNWNAKPHLTTLLHDTLGIPKVYITPSGNPATDKRSINEYAKYYPSKQLRALQKVRLLDTKHRYVHSYKLWADDNGYIHSNLNVTGTRETRQSSTAPNQQNVTGELKKLFCPRRGVIWLDIDFANIELRIWAYSVGNADLIGCFERGESVHMLIFHTLYPKEAKAYEKDPEDDRLKKMYRSIKAGNFAIIYGATERKADETYGYKGATAKVYRRFPGVKEFTQKLIADCEQNMLDFGRYHINTLGGYPLDVPSDEPFKACNYFVQGSAGIIMNLALIAIIENERFIDSDSKLIAQVHDSAVPQIPIHKGLTKTVKSITASMENCALDIFGITPVDFEIKYHPEDIENPYLLELLREYDAH